MLSKCIEDYLTNFDSNYKVDGVTNVIADFVANRFAGKTKFKEELIKVVKSLLYDLRTRKSYLFHNDQLNSVKFRTVVIEAVGHCAYYKSKEEVNFIVPLPTFKSEEPEVAKVLNYILVSWPYHPYHYDSIVERKIIAKKILKRRTDITWMRSKIL